MENIVYILGAGFSAPLGLPVMRNFLEKSKDMYFSTPIEYHYFESIYQKIQNLYYLKGYIKSDLFNIEEILSILEMGYYVGENDKDLNNYKNFLKDVIAHYTPKIQVKEKINETNYSGWERLIFNNYYHYGFFVCSIFNIILKRTHHFKKLNQEVYNYQFSQNENKKYNYSVITLNYDLVIENIFSAINNVLDENKINDLVLKNNIAKLHGSIDTEIILPTWNKSSLNKEYINETWKKAYEMIKNANQIRIIGYSLPFSDNYIKYLFSVGIKDSKNLKKIDVITVDSKENEAEKRYREILIFSNLRFKNSKIEDYFKFIFDNCKINKENNIEIETFNLTNFIENSINGHDVFMEK